MANIIKKYRWFWAWEDEKEETWLSEMAAEGWHLTRISFPGLYHFQQSEPDEIVYRLDYQTLDKKDRESYLQLFQDAGWEHVADMSGWVYFRRSTADAADLEIFNDLESKSKKYQRILIYLIIFLPIFVVLMPELGEHTGTFFQVVQGLYFTMLLIYVYTMIRLLGRIGELDQKE